MRRGDASAVPGSVHDVLAARIDLLPDATRRVLRTASVIGREFSPRLLEPLWTDDSPLEPHLAELKRFEFLYERIGAGGPQYVFAHALTHEVAYEGLLVSTAPHAARGGRADARAPVRGSAGRGGRPPRPPLLEDGEDGKAVEYLSRVRREGRPGLRARRGRPGSRGGPPPRRAASRRGARAARARPSGPPGHLPVLHRPLRGRPRPAAPPPAEGRRARGPAASPASTTSGWGTSTPTSGTPPASERFAARAIEEAERAGDGTTIGKARIVLAWEGFFTGRYAEGAEHARAAVAALEAHRGVVVARLRPRLGGDQPHAASGRSTPRFGWSRGRGRSGASDRTRACTATAPG